MRGEQNSRQYRAVIRQQEEAIQEERSFGFRFWYVSFTYDYFMVSGVESFRNLCFDMAHLFVTKKI